MSLLVCIQNEWGASFLTTFWELPSGFRLAKDKDLWRNGRNIQNCPWLNNHHNFTRNKKNCKTLNKYDWAAYNHTSSELKTLFDLLIGDEWWFAVFVLWNAPQWTNPLLSIFHFRYRPKTLKTKFWSAILKSFWEGSIWSCACQAGGLSKGRVITRIWLRTVQLSSKVISIFLKEGQQQKSTANLTVQVVWGSTYVVDPLCLNCSIQN